VDASDQFLPALTRLHGSSWHEQVAGARALAELAERWYFAGANARAQSCVDALCAYLRVRRYTRSDATESAVREQITALLAGFLRSGLGGRHGALLVNLAAVSISGSHVFDGVSFGPGLRLVLDRVQLEEGAQLVFAGCRFRGCIVRLHEVYLGKDAVLSVAEPTVDAGTWLLASTAGRHPSAVLDVRGLAGPEGNAGRAARRGPLSLAAESRCREHAAEGARA